jgi:hypothetical protein
MAGEMKMCEYFWASDREGIIQGFVPANPIQINPKSSVRRELKENAFNGRRDEDPLEHLQQFYEACESQPIPEGVTEDQVKLQLFKFSLGKTTKDWLICLPSGAIETWRELEDKFLDHFFTEEQHKERQRAITEFQQEKKESLHQSLERFKLYKRRCPNHLICAAELMHIFVNSMKTKQRMILDASAGGPIENKTPTEVEQLIETMCRNEYNKEEDKDIEEVLMGQLEASQSEVDKLQEENKTLKEFMQNFGNQIKESNEKLGVQMQTWTKKVEDIGELQAINLRNRQVEPIEPTKRSKRASGKKSQEVSNSQLPDSQMPDTQPPDTEPNSQDIVDLEIEEEIRGRNKIDVPTTTNPIPEKQKTVFGSNKTPPEPKNQETYIPYPNKDNKKEKQKEQLKKLGQLITQMEIHVPFNDMIQISPSFHKYVKNLVAGKVKLKDEEAVMLTAECSAIF